MDIDVKVETKIGLKERHTVDLQYVVEFDQDKELITLRLEGTNNAVYIPLRYWRAINGAIEEHILCGG